MYDWGFFSRYEVTRNFLFTGLPCFLIGSYIYHHESNFNKISTNSFYLALALLIGLTMLEAFMHETIGTGCNEFYLSSIGIAVLTFIYCIQNPEFKFGALLYKLLGSTGPTIVYLYHMLFVSLLYPLYQINWGVLLIVVLANMCALTLGLIYNYIKRQVAKKHE